MEKDLKGLGDSTRGPCPGGYLGLLRDTQSRGGTQLPPLGRVAHWVRPAERAGLGGAVARWAEWGWTEEGAPPTPFLASRHCGGQSPSRSPPLARPPAAPQLPNAEFSREKKSEQLAARRAVVAAQAFRVAGRSARGPGPRTRLYRHPQPGQARRQESGSGRPER